MELGREDSREGREAKKKGSRQWGERCRDSSGQTAQLLRLGHGGIGAKPGSASSEAIFGPPGLPP